MSDFICKKCGSTEYEIKDKPNGTGIAHGLYCAKCGFWHKWLGKEELRQYEKKDSKDEIIARLQAENAALRERLEKAVELPCKTGDKVYIPWAWDNQSGIVEASVVTIRLYPYTRKYETRLETDSLTFAQKYQYGNFNDKDFGTLIFTTREAAEARLKELQGGKE